MVLHVVEALRPLASMWAVLPSNEGSHFPQGNPEGLSIGLEAATMGSDRNQCIDAVVLGRLVAVHEAVQDAVGDAAALIPVHFDGSFFLQAVTPLASKLLPILQADVC